jgi:hypothetical protein
MSELMKNTKGKLVYYHYGFKRYDGFKMLMTHRWQQHASNIHKYSSMDIQKHFRTNLACTGME